MHSQDAPLFDALVGDSATCLALAKAFYARVQHDPVLRPFFPGKSLRCAIEQLAAFLVQLLGGPAEDTQDRWALSLRDSHRRFAIGARERDAWMRLMIATLDEAPLADAARRTLRRFFEQASAYMINTGPRESPASSLTNRDELDGELSRCWQAQRLIDDAVDAINDGADVATGVHSPLYCVGNECLAPGGADVVRLLVQAGADVNAAEGPKRCTALHMAARRGNVEVAKALLDCGADLDARDSNGVTPLGRARNCRKPEVAALLRARISRATPTGRRRSGA